MAHSMRAGVMSVIVLLAGCGARSDLDVDAPVSDASVAPDPPAVGERLVSNGGYHVCAARVRGPAYCWGAAARGQIGHGATYPNPTRPTRVIGVDEVISIAAGREHSCAVEPSGRVLCWGSNSSGELGDGTHEERALARPVDGITDARRVVAGWGFSCAVVEGGRVFCWGEASASVGRASSEDVLSPAELTDLGAVVDVAAGRDHGCVVKTSGHVACWGSNLWGQLGHGELATVSPPSDVAGIDDAILVSAGDTHSCAIRRSGLVQCWGGVGVFFPVLGNGTTDVGSERPTEATRIREPSSIDSGGSDTCVADDVGVVTCWGGGIVVQPFAPLLDDRTRPVIVSGTFGGARLSVGGATNQAHACIATRDALACWGRNSEGEVGNGTRTSVAAPTATAIP